MKQILWNFSIFNLFIKKKHFKHHPCTCTSYRLVNTKPGKLRQKNQQTRKSVFLRSFWNDLHSACALVFRSRSRSCRISLDYDWLHRHVSSLAERHLI